MDGSMDFDFLKAARDAEDPAPEMPRHPAIDPWRVPVTENARALVADITRQIEGYENLNGSRKRARKPVDAERFKALVSSVVCGLVHLVLTKPGVAGRVSLSKGTPKRYRTPIHGETVTGLLETMATPEMEWLSMEKGYWRSRDYEPRQTTIAPGPRLLARIKERQITLDDLGRQRGGETIILKRGKEWHGDDKERIDYPDTPDTLRMRAEMETINRVLAEADTSVEDTCRYDKPVDANDRHMRRIFNNGVFDQGGRLYGGFWQSMNDEERKDRIWINDERVVILDYQSMSARMVYGLQGVTPPEGDLYTIPGIPRELVKGVVTASLSGSQPRKEFPENTPKSLKKGLKVADVLAAIREHQPVLYASFDKGLGLGLQYRDSEIMVDVLLQLGTLGITALPIHDGVIVAQSDKDAVESTLRETFKRHVGVSAEVVEK